MLYFYVLDADFFHSHLRPALRGSWNERTFAPCRDLCVELVGRKSDIPAESLLRTAVVGLGFDVRRWKAVVGELLIHGADSVPRIPTSPETLCCLLAPEAYPFERVERACYPAILQAHFGTRDLTFGPTVYRGGQVGWNDQADVTRLHEYLTAVDPTGWTVAALAPLKLAAEECSEQLADVRDWWPDLVALYDASRREGCVVVCERM